MFDTLSAQVGDRIRCSWGESTFVGTLKEIFRDGSLAVHIENTPDFSVFVTEGWQIEAVGKPSYQAGGDNA